MSAHRSPAFPHHALRRLVLCLTTLQITFAAQAQDTPPRPPPRRPVVRPGVPPSAPPAAAPSASAVPDRVEDTSPNSLNFHEAATDLVLMEYAQRTQRTLLITPDLPKPPITLRSNPGAPLTDEEYLIAIEQILNLNGIALVPVGEKFLRVTPSSELRKYAPETRFFTPSEEDPADRYAEDGSFISRMLELKHIDINEAKTVIDGFIRTGAQIQTFERSNSILVTDSVDNVNRILEIIEYIDRPIIAREEPHIIPIRHARAADIRERLLQIIADSEAEQRRTAAPAERQAGAPGTVTRPLPAGVTLPRGVGRPGAPAAREAAPSTPLDALVQDAERGIIRGRVQIIADERTNILILITRPENMVFFNRVIDVLDIETAPDVIVEVFRLEHAVATDVASLLNDLIGTDQRDASARAAAAAPDDGERSQALADFARRRQEATQRTETEAKTQLGQLNAENIKILADERTNALVIMASGSDMAAIRDLIAQVDIMLSQVVIETVLIELNFEDTLETGIDWVQRAMRTVDNSGRPVVAFAGRGGGGTLTPADPLAMASAATVGGSGAGLTYFTSFVDLNLDLVLRAAQTDSRARIMSSPVIMTQDNKEAVLEATVRRYFFKGKRYAGTGTDGRTVYEDDVEQQDVGLTLRVTPRINKKDYVVLSIEQTVDAIAGTQVINEQEWPIVSSRRMGSDIAVQSGETVVLGGLAQNTTRTSRSMVPILGHIPILGRLFRSTRESTSRNEVVVFLVPRVLLHPGAAEGEARNRKAYLDTDGIWRSDWSASDLADPITEAQRRVVQERAQQTVVPPLSREPAPPGQLQELIPQPENTNPLSTQP